MTGLQDSQQFYDEEVAERLSAFHRNRATQSHLQKRILAAQEELAMLLACRRDREAKLQVH